MVIEMKLVTQQGRTYVQEGKQLTLFRDYPRNEIAKALFFVLGPLGSPAEMFDISSETRVLYFLKDSKDKPKVRDLVEEGTYAIFPVYRDLMRDERGTLDLFWDNNRKLTKYFAAAMQFAPDKGKLYITHMSVRSKFRRQGLNTLMVDYVSAIYGKDKEVVFDDPTDMGKKFMSKYKSSR